MTCGIKYDARYYRNTNTLLREVGVFKADELFGGLRENQCFS